MCIYINTEYWLEYSFTIDLNNISLNDANYDEEDLDTLIDIRYLAWHI